MSAEVYGNELRIGENSIKHDQRIAKLVELAGRIIILLNSDDFEDGDKLVGRNILAYDSRGNLAWRIEDHGFTIRNCDGEYVPQAYFGLWIDKDGKTLCAGIPIADFEVDPSNGMLLKMEQSRW